MDLSDLYDWFSKLHKNLPEQEQTIGGEVIKEIKTRLEFLLNVGLNYLTLNRSSKSLSGAKPNVFVWQRK